MKKTYISPDFNAIMIEKMLMADQSPTLGINDGPIESEGEILSKGFQGFTMDDDTEE